MTSTNGGELIEDANEIATLAIAELRSLQPFSKRCSDAASITAYDASHIDSRSLVNKQSAQTTRDQCRQVRENERQHKPAGHREVLGRPDGIELVFVLPQSLEIVEVFAVAERERGELVPDRGERFSVDPGQRPAELCRDLISGSRLASP